MQAQAGLLLSVVPGLEPDLPDPVQAHNSALHQDDARERVRVCAEEESDSAQIVARDPDTDSRGDSDHPAERVPHKPAHYRPVFPDLLRLSGLRARNSELNGYFLKHTSKIASILAPGQ